MSALALVPRAERRDAVYARVAAWLRAEDVALFERVLAHGERITVGLSSLVAAARLEECGLVAVERKRGWVNQPRFGGAAWVVGLTERGRDFGGWSETSRELVDAARQPVANRD